MRDFLSTDLIDLQLRKQCVQTVDFLALLHECVVLGDPLQRELVHQVNLVRVFQVLPHEGLHCEGEGGGVEEDLPAGGQVADYPVDAELLIQVSLYPDPVTYPTSP